jgi:tetratricopeptide (TPR) repeat protein
MELMAMRYGLKPKDQAWLDSAYTASMAKATALADSGDGYHAWRKYRAIANDFEGMKDVREATARADRLARNDAVRRTDRHIAETVKAQAGYNHKLSDFLSDFRKSPGEPLDQALVKVQLRELEARVASGDSIDANAAERGLEQLWVYSSFYEPMDYLDRGDPTRALAILEVAQAMRPNHPDVCYNQARAFARLKQERQAIEALECAARSFLSVERIESDPDLKTLGVEPAFRALVTRLRTYPTGSPDRYGQ